MELDFRRKQYLPTPKDLSAASIPLCEPENDIFQGLPKRISRTIDVRTVLRRTVSRYGSRLVLLLSLDNLVNTSHSAAS
jgi:hypothetical protein